MNGHGKGVSFSSLWFWRPLKVLFSLYVRIRIQARVSCTKLYKNAYMQNPISDRPQYGSFNVPDMHTYLETASRASCLFCSPDVRLTAGGSKKSCECEWRDKNKVVPIMYYHWNWRKQISILLSFFFLLPDVCTDVSDISDVIMKGFFVWRVIVGMDYTVRSVVFDGVSLLSDST